jgi:hypothetical protein
MFGGGKLENACSERWVEQLDKKTVDNNEQLAQEQAQQEAELCEKLTQREEELKRKTNEEVSWTIWQENSLTTINSFENVRMRYLLRWTGGYNKKCSSWRQEHVSYILMKTYWNTHQAEQESELAKMEWRFSSHHRSQNEDIDMGSPNTPGDKGQPSSPYAKPWSGTLSFDAIKKIKRTQGILHKARLVSVVLKVSAWLSVIETYAEVG